MTTEPRKIELKYDPALHNGKKRPSTPDEELIYPYLDTAYNLLREAAVRLVLLEVRDQAAAQGTSIGTDEELFAESAATGGPATYMDLAPDNDMASLGFFTAFEVLAAQALEDASEGLRLR